MRSAVPVAVFLVGFASLLFGVWQLSHAWMFVVAGVLLLGAAWLGELAQ